MRRENGVILFFRVITFLRILFSDNFFEVSLSLSTVYPEKNVYFDQNNF